MGNYHRLHKNDSDTAVQLDQAALAAVLSLMKDKKVRGLTLTRRLDWIARIQRNGELYQRVFTFADKPKAIAWLVCTRAHLALNGLDVECRGGQRVPKPTGNPAAEGSPHA